MSFVPVADITIFIIPLANLSRVQGSTACKVGRGPAVAAGIVGSEEACDVVAAPGLLLLCDGGRAAGLRSHSGGRCRLATDVLLVDRCLAMLIG